MGLATYMKNLKIFPKTFITQTIILTIVILIAHGLIFLFMPIAYQRQKESELNSLTTSYLSLIENKELDQIKDLTNTFSKNNNLNITLEIDGKKMSYQGYQELKIVSDKKIDSSIINIAGENLDNNSILLKNFKANSKENKTISGTIFMDVRSIEEAKQITLVSLPFTFALSLIIALFFSFFYSKSITGPIKKLKNTTSLMKELSIKPQYKTNSNNEINILSNNINDLYESLLFHIKSLKIEHQKSLNLEKEKILFLQATSHELKTPLASLRIILESMLLKIEPYTDHNLYLTKSIEEIDKLNQMIQDIIKASKTTDNALKNEKIVRIDATIKEIIKNYEQLAKKKNITLSLNLKNVTYKINPELLKHVLSNIISNAVVHSKKNSEIEIICNKNQLSIKNQAERPFKKEQIKNVFAPFYHLENKDYQGSGMGLYITKLLLDAKGLDFSFDASQDIVSFKIFFKDKGKIIK